MKHWKTALLAMALAAAALLPAGQAEASARDELCTATMWAGQHEDVGTVVVTSDGRYLYVDYRTHSGWTMGTVHVHIGSDLAGVPQNKGGPTPGRFEYHAEGDGARAGVRIPCVDLPKGELTILAHAETFGPGGAPAGDCTLELPLGIVQSCITLDYVSYATHTLHGAGALDGVYEGWCVDVEGGLSPQCFDVTMVSSLDSARNDVIAAPGNWDLINYLLNRVSFWRDREGAHIFDLQWVFWQLSDPATDPSDLPEIPVNPDLADAILADVLTNGEKFVPGPGQYVGVAMVHADPDAQETVIPVLLDCPPTEGGEETAWAGDLEFPGRNWARYFLCEGCR